MGSSQRANSKRVRHPKPKSSHVVRAHRLDWITRIDRARAVVSLTAHALASGHSPYDADVACALELTNEELQRLRDEMEKDWAASNEKAS